MAVTWSDPVQVGPNTYLLRWSSDQDDPSYRVYLNGKLIDTPTTNHTLGVIAGQSAL